MKPKFAAAAVAAALALPVAADTFSLDPPHTIPTFEISHIGLSTFVGRFDKSAGKVDWDKGAKKATIDVTIDAASISTGHAKREEHLKGPDFFNVQMFPKITFKGDVKFEGDQPVSIAGQLTLLGVTKPVTLAVQSFKCGTHPLNKKDACGLRATTTLKRSDFGMKYGLPTVVGDDVKLTIDSEMIKES